MATQEERKLRSAEKFKHLAKDFAIEATKNFEEDPSKKALLLCEGNEKSMDVYIYSYLYPDFLVMSAGGCTNISRLAHPLRKIIPQEVYGIIDRDNCSKAQIRALRDEEKIYCTKLPFIENILCCPELLKIICKDAGKDYTQVVRTVRRSFASLLAEKMSLLNPFNVDIPYDLEYGEESEENEIQLISISIATKNNIVHKKIDLSNVMYTFRNKAIVSLVADAMDFHGRDAYYKFLKSQINSPHGYKVMQVIANYLPIIPLPKY